MDIRVQMIFQEETKGDTSFTERDSMLSNLFGGTKYSKREMRETWQLGIKHGIEIGLRRAGLDGQRVELTRNTTNERHKKFLTKFYQLAAEYKCAIQYHPEHGMVVVDRMID